MPELPPDQAQLLLQVALYAAQAAALTTALYAPRLIPQDYHTSALTGAMWVAELLNGHPDRIWTELGLRKEVFLLLEVELRVLGLTDARSVGVQEQIGIFLYMCVTGLSVRHVGERFQRSNETISRYFFLPNHD